jgi:hypothetical protein
MNGRDVALLRHLTTEDLPLTLGVGFDTRAVLLSSAAQNVASAHVNLGTVQYASGDQSWFWIPTPTTYFEFTQRGLYSIAFQMTYQGVIEPQDLWSVVFSQYRLYRGGGGGSLYPLGINRPYQHSGNTINSIVFTLTTIADGDDGFSATFRLPTTQSKTYSVSSELFIRKIF